MSRPRNEISELDDCAQYFNQIYDETFNQLKRYIALGCSDISYISDILQDIYFDFYKMLIAKGTEHVDDAQSYLFKIAKRKLARYYTLKQKLAVLIPLFKKNNNDDEYCVADMPDSGVTDDDVSEDILNEIEAERIWNIINTYPPDTRKILYLYFSCDMSHSQIASELGCSLSNVKNKLYRTLAEIKKTEKKEGEL